MKCKNCGYEIEKPNQRTCPCCGQSLNSAHVVTPPTAQSMEEESPLETPKQECPNCHTFVPAGTNFCPNCGNNMHEDESVAAPPIPEEPEPSPAYNPEPVDEPEPQPEPQPVYKPAPQPAYKPAPQPAYKPKPVYAPAPEPAWEPEPAPRSDSPDYNLIPDDNGWSGAQIVPDGSESQPTSTSSSSSTLIMVGIALGSLLLGALLYLIV